MDLMKLLQVYILQVGIIAYAKCNSKKSKAQHLKT